MGEYAGFCGSSQTCPSRPLERLDGRLAVDHRRDDLAVLGDRLAPHHDPVAVADRGVDHRVADHLEQEQLAVADQLAGQREHVLDDLLGQDRARRRRSGRPPGRTTASVGASRSASSAPASSAADRPGVVRVDDLDRARPVRVAPQVALALEGHQLVLDRRRAGQPDRLADLPHARRVAAAAPRWTRMVSRTSRCRAVRPSPSAGPSGRVCTRREVVRGPRRRGACSLPRSPPISGSPRSGRCPSDRCVSVVGDGLSSCRSA